MCTLQCGAGFSSSSLEFQIHHGCRASARDCRAFEHPPNTRPTAMDGPPPQEEDFSSIPISDRLAHKNWKARVSAYESLTKTFQNTASDTDPAFKPYINNPDLLRKIATDSNAVAQEKAVECLVSLVKFAGETAAKSREVVVPALVDKCFGSSRAGTKAHALELALQYIEVENGAAGVVVSASSNLSILYI